MVDNGGVEVVNGHTVVMQDHNIECAHFEFYRPSIIIIIDGQP